MVGGSRAKVKELLGRHSELEQSETKAQGALVTILSLTQITELKLLLDIGRQGHRFYDFVLTLLIACVSLEIFIGVIIIYIGNLHYYQSAERGAGAGGRGWRGGGGGCSACLRCLAQSCRFLRKHSGAYESVREPTATPTPLTQLSPVVDGLPAVRSGVDWSLQTRGGMEALGDVEQADARMELARVKMADADVKIIRATNYVKVIEEAFKKTPGNAELEQELGRARDDLGGAQREREEGEAEQRLAEVQQRHMFTVKEAHEDGQERQTFRKISFWQHMATYLLYFVMLMNVFVTTFGISGGAPHNVFGSYTTTTGLVVTSHAAAMTTVAAASASSSVGFTAFAAAGNNGGGGVGAAGNFSNYTATYS